MDRPDIFQFIAQLLRTLHFRRTLTLSLVPIVIMYVLMACTTTETTSTGDNATVSPTEFQWEGDWHCPAQGGGTAFAISINQSGQNPKDYRVTFVYDEGTRSLRSVFNQRRSDRLVHVEGMRLLNFGRLLTDGSPDRLRAVDVITDQERDCRRRM